MYYILTDQNGFKHHLVDERHLPVFFEDHSILDYHTVFKTEEFEDAVSKLFEVMYEKNRTCL